MKGLKLMVVVVVVATVALLGSCKNSSSGSDPAFVGTWTGSVGPFPIVGTGAVTVTLTATTIHSVIDYGVNGADTRTGTVSGVDETAHHFINTLTSVVDTGSVTSTDTPGEYFYGLYDVTGNTLTIESGAANDPTFPTTFTAAALVLTK